MFSTVRFAPLLLACAACSISSRVEVKDGGGETGPDALVVSVDGGGGGDAGQAAGSDAAALPGRDVGVPEPGDIPGNTWVRLTDSPGDPEGREVPPGRASTWVYEPEGKVLLRYGGYTPRFSNALDAFEPLAKSWTRLFAEDENYPETRPGGGCAWTLQYDPGRKRVWLAGGLGNGTTGSRGIWSYDPATKTFEQFSKDLPAGVSRLTLDLEHGVFVASPAAKMDLPNRTQVFDLATRKWTTLDTPSCPQATWSGGFPAVYDEGLKQVVVLGSEETTGLTVWTFDTAAKAWTKVAMNAGPTTRPLLAAAYDPDHKVILVHGVHPGGYQPDTGSLNDTWLLDVPARTWTEIKTPGPTPLTTKRGAETTYRLGLTYVAPLKRFLLFDADLGVWAFRYDPGSGPGAEAIGNGFVPELGKAAQNAPATGPAEIRLTLPSALNPKITALEDNSLVALGGGKIPGSEVGWWLDSDRGVLVKYGGCGNSSSPFWTGYGNSLVLYDPGTERWHTRRVGDVSGALRPGNGCTRSVVYDPGRRVSWFFGGVGSGPYCPAPATTATGSFAYDFAADRFQILGGASAPGMENPGCNVAFGPEANVAIWPGDGVTWVFDGTSGTWASKASPGSPGKPYVYERIAWIKSKQAFLALGITGAAPSQANTTMLYDPKTNTWTDLKAQNQPPFRASKFGLVYDSKNDVAILLGGSVSWNTDWRGDLWAYSFAQNRWEKLTPTVVGGGAMPALTDNMPSAYDERHNAVVFTEGNQPWAYRYRK